MNSTIKIGKSLETSEEKPVDRKTGSEKNRKLRLNRQGEKILPPNDSTDIATAMAATLCHEINNPLMTITAVTEVLLKNHKNLSPDVIEKINGISIAAERIRKATHKLIGLDSLQYCETAAIKMILINDSKKKSADKSINKIEKTAE